MRLWHLDLGGDPDLVADARVLAPDAAGAARAVLSHQIELDDDPVREVRAVRQLPYGGRCVLDLHMWNPDAAVTVAHGSGSCAWRVPYRDGLFHRPEGAALVLAENAAEAEALVIMADPFEGRPFYGVPAEYGPAEPFVPEHPYVIEINLDWIVDDAGEGE